MNAEVDLKGHRMRKVMDSSRNKSPVMISDDLTKVVKKTSSNLISGV